MDYHIRKSKGLTRESPNVQRLISAISLHVRLRRTIKLTHRFEYVDLIIYALIATKKIEDSKSRSF